MIKFLFLYFFLIIFSPFIVLIGQDQFTTSGWLSIGDYSFDVIEGIRRSLVFYFSTFPVCIAIYYSFPSNKNNSFNFNVNKSFFVKDKFIYHIFFYFLCLIYLIFLNFRLGINGVETATDFKLSGLAYYFRAYIGTALISFYIMKIKDPSILLIVIFSLISGFTAASRFVAVIPLLVYFLKIFSLTGKFNLKLISILFLSFSMFTFITFLRTVFYVENFNNSSLYLLFINILRDSDFSTILFQGYSQLFLRIGLGRDIILSYEIANMSICKNYVGLFFGVGSCFNPPLDFYGLFLDNHRFYLGVPQLSSLYIISDNFFIRFVFSILYSFMILIISKLIWLIIRKNALEKFKFFIFLFILIFSLVGPIKFLWYLLVFVIIITSFLKMVNSKAKYNFEGNRPLEPKG